MESLCNTCSETDKSCPFRDDDVEVCSRFTPALPNVYAPVRPSLQPIEVFNEFLKELQRAELKHPVWPTNTLEQVAIMAGESGECLQAALHYVEGRGDIERVRAEAIQTGAMAIRVLMNLEKGQK